MHILSTHKPIRKFIPVTKYEEMIDSARDSSLIGSYVCGIDVNPRINYLQSLESDIGFVYVGEKEWLQRKNEFPTYSSWVKEIIATSPDLTTRYVEYDDEGKYWPKNVFEINVNTRRIKLSFDELTHSSYFFPDEVIINVACISDEVSLSHLVSAFEVIHDLEYILSVVSLSDKCDVQDHISSIDLVSIEEPRLWSIFQEGSGLEFDRPVLNRK
jgi:hypothetical protein